MAATSNRGNPSEETILSIPLSVHARAELTGREAPLEPLTRSNPPLGDVTAKRDAFKVENRTYKQQFASIYFMRLAILKPYCVNVCLERWADMEVAGQRAKQVDRVLDVRQGELGWIVGTVYMDLPLKPNVLEDLARDVRSYVAVLILAFHRDAAPQDEVC
jgi:DNA polymerase delta subunit OB-fold domain